jgi:hypothetical protein
MNYKCDKDVIVKMMYKVLKRKILIIFLLLMVIIFCAIKINNAYKLNRLFLYESNKIKSTMDGNKIKTLNDLINRKDFYDNVLYIYLWSESCDFCIEELKHISSLRVKYQGDPLKFIYLSLPVKGNNKENWLKLIEKYNLIGYHLIINIELYNDICSYHEINKKLEIPHYFLIDKKGAINKINAPKPSQYKILYKQIEEIIY